MQSIDAVTLSYQGSINNPNITAGYTGIPIQESQYSSLPATTGFVNHKVNNYVKVAIDHQFATLVNTPFNYNIVLEISYNDNSTTLYTVNKTFNIQYNPKSGIAYKDYSVYNFDGAHQINVKILTITDANSGATIASPSQNINILYGINIERYWDYNPSLTTCASKTVNDLNSDGEDDELVISWSPISGAEEYELEWTYVDDYTNGTLGSTTSTSAIAYDFKYNSTRISTKNFNYKINLIYERGYVIYRIRGVGRKLSNISTVIYGDWSVDNSGVGLSSITCGSGSYYYSAGHKSAFNWQYSSTFAEEGKKKEVVGYYDGGLRNRQTVTKVNTTDTAIVGESFYDFQGRKAIDVLPVPAQSPALTYYPNFNVNLSLVKYSRDDFDKDLSGLPCDVSTGGMSPTVGSSRYYSSNNTNSANHQTYLPSALNFPFNQVEYTPDNTGRIRRMGGVGDQHQLGSGKETKYYYGKPMQEELDRLFGSEVGYDRHYKKNVVIDPNGQVSISYLDQEGHVIATALSGNTPTNVIPITSQAGADATLNIDLLSKNSLGNSLINAMDIDQTSLIFNTQYLVSTPGQTHSFDYDLTPQTFTSSCLQEHICFDCVYDLEIQIRDECGLLIYSNPVRVGSLTLDNTCGGIVYVPSENAPTAFNITDMPIGNYQISKVLTVNRAAYEYYLTQFLDAANNTCFKSYETILIEEQEALAGIDCEDDCSLCIESLGASDAFVLSGKGTYDEWLIAYNQCLDDCKNPSICEQTYQTMLADMMPGGQYAEWYDSLDLVGFNADKHPLSILNYNNYLPDGGLVSSDANAAYWKNPVFVKRDGTTLNGYYDQYGLKRSKIPVLPVVGGYFPKTSSTFIENDVIYTYPENLIEAKDFTSYWQESWARSLVKYHPEYCYFKWCSVNMLDTVSNATMSSEDFDNNIFKIITYASATSNGYISTGTDYALIDLDPFFNIVADGILQNTAMKAQIDNYLQSGMSMKEMAALTVKCPSYFGGLAGVNSTCTSFVATGTASIDDAVWEQYKMLYYSAKQKLIKIAADNYAIDTSGSNCGKGYNGCIGKDNFNPFASAYTRYLTINSFTTNYYMPCNWATFLLYKHKVMRFTVGDEELTKPELDIAQYNVYYKTGLCPAENDLNYLLHDITTKGELLNTFSLKTMPSFTKLLYNEILAPTIPSSTYVDYDWTPTIDPLDAKNLDITFVNGASSSVCVLKLIMPTSAYTWAMVRDFKNIAVGQFNFATGTTGFNIIAMVDHDLDISTPNIPVNIMGNSCVKLGECSFYDQCKNTDFGTRLISLMGALANGGQLTSTTSVDLESSYPKYLNRYLRNTVTSSSNTDLRWIMPNSSLAKFELYDLTSTGTSQNIEVSFNTFTPAFSISNLYKIKYFTDLKIDDNNVSRKFYVTAWYETAPLVTPLQSVVIHGEINQGNMAICEGPSPVECQTKEHEAAKDLGFLLNKWFETNPTVSYDLNTDNDFSELLESYVGFGHHIQLENIIRDDKGFKAEINVYSDATTLYNSCNVNLYHLTSENTDNFIDIVSLSNFEADQSKKQGLQTYHFKVLATYSNGETELIGGYTSCIPIRSCPCGSGKPLIGSCSDKARLTMDNITKYNTNKLSNNPNGLIVPQITEDEFKCGCAEGYINYLVSYTNIFVKPLSYLEYTFNNCQLASDGCPDYVTYFNTLTEYNNNNPLSIITIVPLDPTFNCSCIDAYVDYINSFKLTPKPYPTPPISITSFLALGCLPPPPVGGSGSDDCSAIGLSYWNMANNAVNNYNAQIPAPAVPLVMSPYNPSIDCNCYLRYAIYLSGNTYPGGTPKYPNPAKSFTQFEAEGCEDNDCWAEYNIMISRMSNAAFLAGNIPPYSPPAYDPDMCGCYNGYSWYVMANYGTNMMSVDEWCSSSSPESLSVFFDDSNLDSLSNGNNNEESGDGINKKTTKKKIKQVPYVDQVMYRTSESNVRNLSTRSRCLVDTFITEYLALPDPCIVFKTNQAIHNAKKRYEDQLIDLTTEFRQAYYTKCLSLTESFTGEMPIKDYHYTLYYYDQAGSLVATVPPEGVQLINLTAEGAQIKSDRDNNIKTVFNEHYLKTTYEYNSLNQLKRQSVPDNDKIDVWEVDNSSGIPGHVIITDIQFADGNIGFSIGKDAAGYGYIYKTIDGGLSWKRVDPKSADLNKIKMIDANNGYAVGNDGLLLKTTDGGINWQVITIKTGSEIVVNQLNDLIVRDVNTIIAVGNLGTIVKGVLSGSTWTFTDIAGSNIDNTMNITSIAADVFGSTPAMDKTYITVSIPSATSNANRIFINTSTFSSTTWTDNVINTKLNAGDLMAVYFYNSTDGYAAGVNGTLLKTTDGGTNWNHLATNTITNFVKLYFYDVNKGLALADNGKLYSTINAGENWQQASIIGTYKDWSFFNKTDGKGYAVGEDGLVAYINFLEPKQGNIIKKLINTIVLPDDLGAVAAVNINDVFAASATGDKIYKIVKNGDRVKIENIGNIPTVTGFKAAQFASATKGAFVTNNGKIYNCIYSGSYSFTDISVSSAVYSDIGINSTGVLYALNTGSTTYLHKTNDVGWTTMNTLSGSGSTLLPVSAFYIQSSDVVVVGDAGTNLKYNGTTYADNSLKTAPLTLTDVFAVETSAGTTTNTAYAVGYDGTVIRTTDGGTTWYTLNSGTASLLNAAAFENTTDGVIVGNSGVTLKSTSSGITLVASVTNRHLRDISYNSSATRYSIAGQSRIVLQTTNSGSSFTVLPVLGNTTETFNTIIDIGSAVQMMGNNGYVIKKASGSWYNCYKQPYALTALHIHKTKGIGMILGKNGTSLYTTDKGYTWTLNKPTAQSGITLYDFTGVAVYNASHIYATALGEIPIKYNNLQASSRTTLTGTGITAQNWNDVQISDNGIGYIAGANSKYASFTANGGTACTIGSNTGAPGTYSVNSIGISHNKVFFACDAGKFFSLNTVTSAINDYTSSSTTTEDLLKYAIYDKLNGVLLGKNGTMVRIWDQNGNLVFDNKTALNNNGTAVTHHLQAADYGSRNHLVYGGESGFVKNLETEKQYTSLFWYDKLGRMVVSQNTRQYNKTVKAYSYTQYDALGRIKEVGEIAQSVSISKQYTDKQLDNTLFAAWITGGTRTEVTQTYYDVQFAPIGTLLKIIYANV